MLAVTATPASATPGGPGFVSADREVPTVAVLSVQSKPVRLRQLERRVLRKLNAYRRSKGRPTVKGQKRLRQAAMAHARAMAVKGFFSHDSANGESFDVRVGRYYRMSGFRSWRVGENLLWSSGSLSAKRAIALWRNSPGHRRNMLDRRWRSIGVAVVRMRSAPGVFGGIDVTIAVTDFGARS